jgi:hypothetical protein
MHDFVRYGGHSQNCLTLFEREITKLFIKQTADKKIYPCSANNQR